MPGAISPGICFIAVPENSGSPVLKKAYMSQLINNLLGFIEFCFNYY